MESINLCFSFLLDDSKTRFQTLMPLSYIGLEERRKNYDNALKGIRNMSYKNYIYVDNICLNENGQMSKIEIRI